MAYSVIVTAPPPVEDKNVATRAAIERAARMAQGDDRPDWLDHLLESHDLDPQAGILVEYDTVDDQGQTLCHGTWLTKSRKFWAFEVWVSPGAEPRVEVFEDITAVTSTADHYPGLGKSFGALALEALEQFLPALR